MRYLAALLAVTLFAALPARVHAQKGAKGDMDFEPEEIGKSGPPSKQLDHAKKLYDKGDYYSSSIEFFKVVNGETNDSEANKQTAQFFLGKTMYQMKFYAAALKYFSDIVDQGGAHRYYGITLKWLAALAKVLPESAGILEKIGKYSREDLEAPALDAVRPELYYLLGRHFYRAGNFDQAIELFQAVPRDSEFYIKAKFFEGVTFVRKNDGAPAVEAFKEILTIAKESDLRRLYKKEDVREYEELANLSMARVFYTTRNFDTAIKYFEKIPQESPWWLTSLFEASWAYFLKTGYSKALGNVHTLGAPYFENEFDSFMAEAVNLKAIMYYNFCRYDRAEEAVAEFRATYPELIDELRKVAKKEEQDNAEFFHYVQKLRAGSAGLPLRVSQLAQSALQDKTLEKTFAWVDELERELKQHDKADRAWKTTSISGEVLQELSVQKSLAEAEAGRLARERLERLVAELNEKKSDASKIKIETLKAKLGQKKAEMQQQEVFGQNKEEAIVIDDEHFMWSFNGEYWKDELGFYRYRISSRCKRGAGGVAGK